jgi:hypothetical protein
MKRFLALFSALLAVASWGYSQKFSLELRGGMTCASGGDFAEGIKGEMNYLRDEFKPSGEFGFPHLGMDFAAELTFRFRPKWGAGLAVGYIANAKEGQVLYDIDAISIREIIRPRMSVFPIIVRLHHWLPLSSKMQLDLSAGGGLYLARFKWDYLYNLTYQGYSGMDEYIFDSIRPGYGFQAGIGLELGLTSRASLLVGISGRYAVISKFKGDWTDKGSGDFWEYDDQGSDHYAWYYDWGFDSKTYGQIAFEDQPPIGSTISNARYARLILASCSATIGLRIGL